MARPASRVSTLAHSVESLVHAIAGLVDGLSSSVQDVKDVGKAAKGVKAAVKGRGNRKPRSAASRAAQAKKMRAYWAKRRAGKGSAKATVRRPKKAKVKPAAKSKGGAWASMTSEQRAERVAKMRAGQSKTL